MQSILNFNEKDLKKFENTELESDVEFETACRWLIQIREDKNAISKLEKSLTDKIKPKLKLNEETNGLILTTVKRDKRDNKGIDGYLKSNGVYDLYVSKEELTRLNVVKEEK